MYINHRSFHLQIQTYISVALFVWRWNNSYFLFDGFFFTVFQSSTDQFRKNFQLQNLRNEIPRGEIQERLWNTVNP